MNKDFRWEFDMKKIHKLMEMDVLPE